MNFLQKCKERLQWTLTSREKKEAFLEEAFSILRKDPNTAALLKMARADNIKIQFAPKLIGTNTEASFSPLDQMIRISPGFDVGDIAVSLAHELRHYWQCKKLGLTAENYFDIYRTPKLAFIFNRVAEADAYAFQGNFTHKMNKKLNGPFRKAAHKEKAAYTREEALQKKRREREKDISLLRKIFFATLASDGISSVYDPVETRRVYGWYIVTSPKKRKANAVNDLPNFTMANLRKLLKAGVTDNAPDYMGDLTDAQFEKVVLMCADKASKHAVLLVDKLNKAEAVNDKKAARALRPKVKQKAHELFPNM